MTFQAQIMAITEIAPYFAFAHLPDRLQDISRPFHEISTVIEDLAGEEYPADDFRDLQKSILVLIVNLCVAILERAPNYRHQAIDAVHELTACSRSVLAGDLVDGMRRLLQAKDCAVRAALP